MIINVAVIDKGEFGNSLTQAQGLKKSASEHNIVHMDSSYNDHSACQAYAASILAELLGRAAKKVNSSLPEGVHLNVCEYGCATGGSSILPLQTIENNTSKDRPIRVTMVDLPNNDWHVLKATVETEFPTMEFGYKASSMYEPISEEGSVHLAYSCYAQHWLSGGAPTGLPNGAIWANQLSSEDDSRKKWEAASKQDWETLLAQRAKEVASGGMMCLHIQSATTAGGLSEAFASVLQQVKLDMVKSGELSEALAQTMVMPEYAKSPLEIVAPLSSSPNDLLWDLESIQYCKLPCAYTEEYHARGGCKNTPNHEEKKDEDDRHLVDVLGKGVVKKEIDSLRAFMGPSIVASVGTAKTDLFWANVEERVGSDPELLSSDYMATFIVLRRTKVHCE